MMPNLSLLKSLDFTKSVGNGLVGDHKFNDASEVGEFPFEQRIRRVEKIEVYTDIHLGAPEIVAITGLAVTYLVDPLLQNLPMPPPPPVPVRVTHGFTNGEPGVVTLKENEILVGASGKLKQLDRRLSFIAFYVFDKDTGLATVQGPFGNDCGVKESWGSYGPIIAFQGTDNPKVGLTSLGFTRLIQGVPEYGIAAK